MIRVKWSPQHQGEHRDYRFEAGVLHVGDIEWDLSDEIIVEYDIPEELAEHALAAKRIDGVLHLELRQGYGPGEKHLWERRGYYGPGTGYRGSQYEEYEDGELA